MPKRLPIIQSQTNKGNKEKNYRWNIWPAPAPAVDTTKFLATLSPTRLKLELLLPCSTFDRKLLLLLPTSTDRGVPWLDDSDDRSLEGSKCFQKSPSKNWPCIEIADTSQSISSGVLRKGSSLVGIRPVANRLRELKHGTLTMMKHPRSKMHFIKFYSGKTKCRNKFFSDKVSTKWNYW